MTVSQDRLLYVLLVCTYGFLYTKLVKLYTNNIKKNWPNDLETFFSSLYLVFILPSCAQTAQKSCSVGWLLTGDISIPSRR